MNHKRQPSWQWGATRTEFGFHTGQRLDGFGLMDYNARYYSSTLGRFVSPDSIIPQSGSPLATEQTYTACLLGCYAALRDGHMRRAGLRPAPSGVLIYNSAM